MNPQLSSEAPSPVRGWKPYPAYTDFGIEWLGTIPTHWEVKRLKFIAPLQGGYAFNSELFSDEGVPVVRMNNLKRGKLDFEDAVFISEAGCISSFDLREGDVLLGMSGSIGETGSLGNFAIVKEQDLPCQLNQRVGRFRLQPQIERGFLIHFIQSASFSNPLIAIATSTAQFNISPGDVGKLDTPLPPSREQRAIAAFLERETAKIDALVAKKKRLIALLQEKRAALITRAVTKGLDPNVPMKDSGVEWLGEIPAHWNVIRIRHACSDIFLGLTSRVDYVGDGGFPLVRAVNISGGILDFSEARYISDEQHRELTKYHRPKLNDVLLSKSGSIGTAALVETAQEFSIYESIFALRGRLGLLKPKFLLYLLRSDICQRQYSASSVGMGVGHLNMSDIVDVRVALPTLSEQCATAEYLDRETLKIDSMILKVEEAIECLQEYRTALISAAVTGKIDVRGEMAA